MDLLSVLPWLALVDFIVSIYISLNLYNNSFASKLNTLLLTAQCLKNDRPQNHHTASDDIVIQESDLLVEIKITAKHNRLCNNGCPKHCIAFHSFEIESNQENTEDSSI